MPIPTDHGYALLRSESDGTKTVFVSTGMRNGRPENVFARHFHVPAVRVHDSVRLVTEGSISRTDRVVEVFVDRTGLVNVRAVQRSTGHLYR